jgi:hypothetical protein
MKNLDWRWNLLAQGKSKVLWCQKWWWNANWEGKSKFYDAKKWNKNTTI